MRVYLKDKHALAYFHNQATPGFWDEYWKIENLQEYILACKSDDLFLPLVKTYLSPGSTVLEGGCGCGQLVHALGFQGYKAIGIDFAEQTVRRIRQAVPELDIRMGDVRNLSIDTNELDGYVSVGVIEHFWEGYSLILSEMARTIKPGGFLFISFPYLSPLRKLKIQLGNYPMSSSEHLEKQKAKFYQFALNWRDVLKDLQQRGFTLKDIKHWDGIKGFKDEVHWFIPVLQPIYDGKKYPKIRPHLDRIFKPFASHCIILVVQKF